MKKKERTGKIILYSLLLFMVFSGTAVSLYFHFRYQTRPYYSKVWIGENIREGMSKEQVVGIIGKPQNDEDGGWIYYVRTSDDDNETATRIFLIFEGDIVSRVSVVSPQHYSSSRTR